MFQPTSRLLCPGPYMRTLVPHLACYAQVPTASPLLCSTLYQPTMPHDHPSPTSSLFCAQAPTSSLLCSGSNRSSILHEAGHAQTPTYSSIIPTMARSQHVPTDILPVMLRPLHYNPSPTSSLLCSGPYIITQVLHQACHAQVPTANRLYLCPNICFYPPSYMMLVMLNPLRTSSRFLHQACYAQAPTYGALLLEACYAQAPTSAP